MCYVFKGNVKLQISRQQYVLEQPHLSKHSIVMNNVFVESELSV